MKARNSATSAFVQCGGSVPASPNEGGASVAVAVGAGVRVGTTQPGPQPFQIGVAGGVSGVAAGVGGGGMV